MGSADRRGTRAAERGEGKKASKYANLEAEVITSSPPSIFLMEAPVNPPLTAKACVHSAIERTLNKVTIPAYRNGNSKNERQQKKHLLRHFETISGCDGFI